MNKRSILTTLAMGLALTGFSKEIQGLGQKVASPSSGDNVEKVMAACSIPAGRAELDVNNVRTVIWTGGDMWWDLNNNAYYKIPKDGNSHSLFAGSLWIGGLDAGGQLKIAAMTYRQSGVDFWPGPLDTVNNDIDQTVCSQYDKIFQMSRSEVDTFLNDNYISNNLNIWPGNGDVTKQQGKFLAPFYDNDGDGYYNPSAGDYPDYDVNSDGVDPNTGKCRHKLFGDKTLWWVFNDKGDIHSETGGLAMGMEIRAQAFAFKTDNEINDMTFYSYEIINRSSYALTNTYMTVWNDADLGYYNDDLVGCDVGRGLGYIYNGDGYDEDGSGAVGYHETPPSVGCDFFQGPLADPGDGINNDRDSTYDATTGAPLGANIDEIGEQCIMSGFFYYNNNIGGTPTATQNPSNATQFYGYMTGFWRDGSPFTYGGSGYNSGTTACKFVFPGNTDPSGYGTNFNTSLLPWDAVSGGDVPADKRFLQSAGPFTLQPGAVNYITFGLPWARTTVQNNPLASVELLFAADDKAQALFDNCFNVIDGPDAPDVTIQELDKELLLYLSYKPSQNNYNEEYSQVDPTINPPLTVSNLDKSYDFEGFIIYQLKNATVTEGDLYNLDKARIVAQCDIKNGVTKLVNYEFDAAVGVAVPKVKVEGADAGIVKSFRITSDKFATGSTDLINHKTYYYMAIAYAYNEYVKYKPDQYVSSLNDTSPSFYGQKTPFLRGRRNIKKYTAIPHIPSVESEGTILNSSYGMGPKITRIEGQGNGGNVLDLTDETVAAILAKDTGRILEPTYANGRGPVKVKVIDPLNVPDGQFTLKILGGTASNLDVASAVKPTAEWVLTFTPAPGTSFNGNPIDSSNKSIKIGNEQIIPEKGISVYIEQVTDPSDGSVAGSGIVGFGQVKKSDHLESTVSFSDATKPWLSYVPDGEGSGNYMNWILSGSYVDPTATEWNDYPGSGAVTYLDPEQVWEGVNGGWAPYRMCNRASTTGAEAAILTAPAFIRPFISMANTNLRALASVDVVITSDKSKWTRACVLEENNIPSATFPSGVEKLSLRGDPSVDKDGKTIAGGASSGGGKDDADFISATGMGWFPGYAINVETGERLNIAFGENSTYGLDNGRDMIWNPTANVFTSGFTPVFGGMHYIYVFGHNADGIFTTPSTDPLLGKPKDVPRYDYGKAIYDLLATNNAQKKAEVYRDAMWVNVPVINPEFAGISKPFKNLEIPCDVKFRLRVSKPYRYGLATHYSGNIASMPTNAVYNPALIVTDTVANSQNNNMPMYKFSTSDLSTKVSDAETAVNALDLINIVPNPYYGASTYETIRLDSRVKITNLPENCKVRIYTLNGTLIRTFEKDSDVSRDGTNYRTSLDWDLKNQKGIPIASGLYIIHVDAPGIGEKIIKWFGVMRPYDLQSY